VLPQTLTLSSPSPTEVPCLKEVENLILQLKSAEENAYIKELEKHHHL